MKRIFHLAGIGVPPMVRLILGSLFIWSSLFKIHQPYLFLANVFEYELVGLKMGLLVAMTLPWLELLTGICLLCGLFVRGALLASAAMGIMFIFAQASALYHGLNISCGCFRANGEKFVSYLTVIRSCLLFIAAMTSYVCLLYNRRSQLNPALATCKGGIKPTSANQSIGTL